MLTFAGAYAVLPDVYQGAVAHYGWLSAGQMMNRLALGAPGPLTAITAAVVGVIANLALFFGRQGLWPHGWQAEPD